MEHGAGTAATELLQLKEKRLFPAWCAMKPGGPQLTLSSSAFVEIGNWSLTEDRAAGCVRGDGSV